MDARLDLFTNPVATKFIKHVNAASLVARSAGVPIDTLELMALRVSQINGCAVCVDMHTKDAIERGETSLRLNLVVAWREATVFTEAERAALALAEEGTRLADAAPWSQRRGVGERGQALQRGAACRADRAPSRS